MVLRNATPFRIFCCCFFSSFFFSSVLYLIDCQSPPPAPPAAPAHEPGSRPQGPGHPIQLNAHNIKNTNTTKTSHFPPGHKSPIKKLRNLFDHLIPPAPATRGLSEVHDLPGPLQGRAGRLHHLPEVILKAWHAGASGGRERERWAASWVLTHQPHNKPPASSLLLLQKKLSGLGNNDLLTCS